MPFEVFTRGQPPPGMRPTISMHRSGRVALNAAAYAILGRPETVELLFDREVRRMGIRRASGNATTAYRLDKSPGAQTYVLSGRAFARYYGIEVGHSWRRDAEFADGVLSVEIPSGVDPTDD